MLSDIALPPDPVSQHRWLLRLPHVSDKSIETFLALFADFAALGNAGAFVARDSDGNGCSMRLRGERRHADGSIDLLVDVAHCDPRYARPLRNVVFGMGEMLESPVLEFRANGVHPNPADLLIKAEVNSSEVLVGHFYPPVSSKLKAQIQFLQPPNYRSGRRVWLVAANELSIPLVEDLTLLVEKWGATLAAAYPNTEAELRNGATIILNVEASQHDEVTFEVLIDRFIAAEAAFCSLVNMLVIRAGMDTRVLHVYVE